MNPAEMARLIYEHTSGYPFLVSKLCKLMDEEVAGSERFPGAEDAWTYAGFLEAERMLLGEKNTLFESMVNKLYDFPELKDIVYAILFMGKESPYNALNEVIAAAEMFRFVKNVNGVVTIANRIFEMVFYNLFLTSAENQNTDIYKAAIQDKNQFVYAGHLNVERTDVIIDYRGEQSVIELKIWRGNAYNERGEKQLVEYLDHYHLKKGYMLSFNFNKKKEIGVKRVVLGDKILVEAVV